MGNESNQPPDVDALADGIFARLKRSMGGGRQHDPDLDMGGDQGGRVPYSRFASVTQERNALREQLAELGKQVEQLQAGYGEKLKTLQAETAETVKGIGQRHEQDLQLVDMGLTDPLGRKVLRDAWDLAPKADRGKTPVEWWQQQVQAHQAHQADPEAAPAPSVPRVLSPYLPTGEAKQAAPTSARPGPSGRPPAGPGKRPALNLDAIPTDKGFATFLGELQKMEGPT